MSAAPSQLCLEVISGNSLGSTILVEDELIIGRQASGIGQLADDEELSRQHARISREATGDYAIEDLGSSNGTFVNGLRINSPRLLSLGDSIETGATTLVVSELVQADTPLLSLKLEVDCDARAAQIALADGGEIMHMVFADGAWRTSTPAPDADG
jgi:pSer/pThr/pTyr-binding forkhead associated (FHA) protein